MNLTYLVMLRFMDQGWQYTGSPANPAAAAIGPQLYDNHLYFNFGGVAPNATEESYMQTLCRTSHPSLLSFDFFLPLRTY